MESQWLEWQGLEPPAEEQKDIFMNNLRWNLADHDITWREKDICLSFCFFQVHLQSIPFMQEAPNIFITDSPWKVIVWVRAQKVTVGGARVKIKILIFGMAQKRGYLVFIAIIYSTEVFKYPLSSFYHAYTCSSFSLSLFDLPESNCVWKST